MVSTIISTSGCSAESRTTKCINFELVVQYAFRFHEKDLFSACIVSVPGLPESGEHHWRDPGETHVDDPVSIITTSTYGSNHSLPCSYFSSPPPFTSSSPLPIPRVVLANCCTTQGRAPAGPLAKVQRVPSTIAHSANLKKPETRARLGTACIDVLQLHRYDYSTPPEETMNALHGVIQSGKVRYTGASSMWATQFAERQHAKLNHSQPIQHNHCDTLEVYERLRSGSVKVLSGAKDNEKFKKNNAKINNLRDQQAHAANEAKKRKEWEVSEEALKGRWSDDEKAPKLSARRASDVVVGAAPQHPSQLRKAALKVAASTNRKGYQQPRRATDQLLVLRSNRISPARDD
ncbi:hypothetical protein QBC46DRAFT_356118 [Diplogelasinospora grovesii]|uniref:NADP-dependent oxidoreductase domain-containing protein n=1 Tax=Diplogelasinospora grovesii TaxID=303347 RepID=A0AAN6N3G9_9PEZI|nr:hypothetical protein QBC46DRAFT_356118 [Diplogelasinospora grovesii]